MCRTSEYTPRGSSVRGLAPGNNTRKIVFEIDYSLSKAQLDVLESRFPTVEFVSVGFGCHDHPIAHTSYALVSQGLLQKLPAGAKAADICGNPGQAERFNRRSSVAAPVIDVFCSVLSPKDAVRAKTRWGPEVVNGVRRWENVTLYDMYRNPDNVARFGNYSHFLMNHVLYYYTFSDITKLLHMNKESVLMATLHKLPGESGFVNGNEQQYTKDLVTGEVKMWNVETGEYYKHPDPAPWFSKFDYADEHGAIAWTVNKACEDTYVLTITSCPPNLVPQEHWAGGEIVLTNDSGEKAYLAPITAQPDTPPPAYVREEVVINVASIPGYTRKPVTVTITHPDLYKKLCDFMINRKRNSKTLVDLTAKAHREVGNNALIGGSGVKLKITTKALTEHIAAAFVGQVGLEEDLLEAVLPGAGKSLANGKARMIYQTVSLVACCRDLVKAKDPAHAVLQCLDDVFKPGLL